MCTMASFIMLASSATFYSTYAGGVSPEQIRASYIIKMRTFFKLGTSGHAISNICYYEKAGVLPEESVGQIIAEYFGDRPEAKVRVTRFDAIRDFNGCDLLYVPEKETDNVENIVAALGNSPILSVSATPKFIFKGGMIGFVSDDDGRVKMATNLRNIKTRGIHVNPQILEIMQQVVE